MAKTKNEDKNNKKTDTKDRDAKEAAFSGGSSGESGSSSEGGSSGETGSSRG